MTLVLPAPALRRSWLARWLDENAGASTFRRLLRRLAPSVYRAMPDRSGMACYKALLKHVDGLFPVFEPDLVDFWDEEDAAPNPTERALDFGIPIDAQGLDEEYISSYPRDVNPAILVALIMLSTWPSMDLEYWDYPGEELLQHLPKDAAPRVKPYLNAGMKKPIVYARPPGGRRWLAPWAGVADLVDWCRHNTGSGILDYNQLMIEEGGEYPRWTLEEIRGFAADWKRYKPVWERIVALFDHIREHPADLPLVAALLAGDKKARLQLSEPKPRLRTLAQIFSKDSR